MIVHPPQQDEFRFTGKHMLICMLLFFGVVIAVNFTMAYLASGSWTGLVVKNSYVASQKFNGELLAAREQAKSGLRSEIGYRNGIMTISVAGSDGRNKRVGDAVLWVGRPAAEQHDRTLAPDCRRNAVCTAELGLAPGAWLLRIGGTVDGQPYRRDMRLWVSDDGSAKAE